MTYFMLDSYTGHAPDCFKSTIFSSKEVMLKKLQEYFDDNFEKFMREICFTDKSFKQTGAIYLNDHDEIVVPFVTMQTPIRVKETKMIDGEEWYRFVDGIGDENDECALYFFEMQIED